MNVPRDPVEDIFTRKVLEHLQSSTHPSVNLIFRLAVIQAHGPYPSEAIPAIRLRSLRAYKAAWNTYFLAAFACKMFEGEKGKDIRSRLTGTDDDNFRSAMAECLVCWFLAGRMKLNIDPFAPGRNGRNLEMVIKLAEGDIGVEVKAPFRETPEGAWSGDDADKIEKALEVANRQFSDQDRNMLFIVPRLRIPVYSHRRDLIRAAYGQEKITMPLNTETGEAAGSISTEFFQDGKFLNTTKPGSGGKPIKPDGLPAYRRISAIICIEEKRWEKYPHPNPLELLQKEHRNEIWPMWEKAQKQYFSQDNEIWIDHDVLVLHNPYAYHPINKDMWNEFPQFVPEKGVMKWTDCYDND